MRRLPFDRDLLAEVVREARGRRAGHDRDAVLRLVVGRNVIRDATTRRTEIAQNRNRQPSAPINELANPRDVRDDQLFAGLPQQYLCILHDLRYPWGS